MNDQEQFNSGQPDERITQLNSTPIIIDGIESLRKELSAIQELIKDQNEDWKVRIAALQRFQRLMDLEQIMSQFNNAQYGETNFEQTQNNLLSAGNIVHLLQDCKIPQALISQVEDRRSNLCKEACKSVTAFARTFRSGFNFYVDELAPSLLKLLIITIKVIADSAHSCIESFVAYTYPTILPHIQTSSAQAHPVLKSRCAEYLFQILENKQIESQKLEPFVTIIEETLRRQLGDSAPATRATARKSFLAFKTRWESRADSLFESLEPALQKTLSTVDTSVKAKATIAPKRTNFRAFLKNQTQNQEDEPPSSPQTSARSDSSSHGNNNNNDNTSSSDQPANNASQNNSLQTSAEPEILLSPSKRKIEPEMNQIIQDVIHPSSDNPSSPLVEEPAPSKEVPINRTLNFDSQEPSKERHDIVSLESAPSTEPAEVAAPIAILPSVDSALVQTPEPIQELPQSQSESSPSLPEPTPQLPAPQSESLKPLIDEVQPHKKRAVDVPPKVVVAKSQSVPAAKTTRVVPTVNVVTTRRNVATVPAVSTARIATSGVAPVSSVRSQPTSARLAKPVASTKTTSVSTARKVGITTKPKGPVTTMVLETATSDSCSATVAMKVKENIPPATLVKASVVPATKTASKPPVVASNRILKPWNGVRPVDISVRKTKSEPIVKLRVISKPKTEPAPAAPATKLITTTKPTITSSVIAPAPAAPVRKLVSHRLKKTSPTAVRIMNAETKNRLPVVPTRASELAAKKAAVSKKEGTIASTSVRQFPVRTKPIMLSPRAVKPKPSDWR